MARIERRSTDSDGIQSFMNQAGKIPLLTHDEEILLGRRIQALQALLAEKPDGPYNRQQMRIVRTGKRAKERMITANLRLVVSIAKRYTNVTRHLDLNDLVQEGMFGLIRGVEKFDPERGYKASTYLYWWIRQGISRAISQQDRVIRLPVNAIESLNKLRTWMPAFLREHGRPPTAEECAAHVGVTPFVMRLYLQHMPTTISLDAQVGMDNDSVSLLDLVASIDANPMDVLELDDGIGKVQSWMGDLTDQQLQVIRLRYGLDGKGAKSQKSASTELGVSRQAVQQIEQRSLQKMRLCAFQACA